MKRICVVTGTRADYGLLKWFIAAILDSDQLDLHLVTTGMHMSPEFGLTWREIASDGFRIDRRVEMLLSSDTGVGMAKSIGFGVSGLADVYADLSPDLVVVLGDRFEALAAATAALALRIPIAHVHGGELSEGALDDAFRHAITKMSHMHFVASESSRRRVIQMGEPPERVHLVGALGLDGAARAELLERSELEAALGLKLLGRNLLITFHPETLNADSVPHLRSLLSVLDELEDVGLVFTYANADAGGRAINREIDKFVLGRPHSRVYASLGEQRYLSCLRHFDGVVGNSSSGLIEAPYFKVGTVNIGNRQAGRDRGLSVIDCAADEYSIRAAIDHLFSKAFHSSLNSATSPYGTPGAAERMLKILEGTDLSDLLVKHFNDLGQ